MPLRSATDRYLVATESVAQGRFRQAVSLLREATDQDPQNFWAWFMLGVCHDRLTQYDEAAACYSTSIALWPKFPWAYFNRGSAHLRRQDFKQAVADLDQAIRLQPDITPEVYINRALARQGLKEYTAAVEDLTTALDLGAPPTYVYFLRSQARRLAGDGEGAAGDQAEGMRLRPTDEMGWLARGYARLSGDVAGALADFEEALKLNPRSLLGLQNKAHALSKLNRNPEAVQALDRALELYPDFIRSRAGRGVLLARLGQREAAHKDADECLAHDHQPITLYQLAGIYALTSQTHAEDRKEALRLLSAALLKGCGFDLLVTDRDLDPIRDCPEFKALVPAARALSSRPPATTQR